MPVEPWVRLSQSRSAIMIVDPGQDIVGAQANSVCFRSTHYVASARAIKFLPREPQSSASKQTGSARSYHLTAREIIPWDTIALIQPTLSLRNAFDSIAEEFLAEDDSRYQDAMADFERFVQRRVGGNLASGRVPQSTFWRVRDANLAKRLQELKSFTFLTCDEIKGRVLERFGAQVSRTCYYKMVTESETRYYSFLLTSDDKVADFNSFVE